MMSARNYKKNHSSQVKVKFCLLQTIREKQGGFSWHGRNWDLLHDWVIKI